MPRGSIEFSPSLSPQLADQGMPVHCSRHDTIVNKTAPPLLGPPIRALLAVHKMSGISIYLRILPFPFSVPGELRQQLHTAVACCTNTLVCGTAASSREAPRRSLPEQPLLATTSRRRRRRVLVKAAASIAGEQRNTDYATAVTKEYGKS